VEAARRGRVVSAGRTAASGFKDEFRALWSPEAAAVPHGRARFLCRYGRFDLASRLAPYAD